MLNYDKIKGYVDSKVSAMVELLKYNPKMRLFTANG